MTKATRKVAIVDNYIVNSYVPNKVAIAGNYIANSHVPNKVVIIEIVSSLKSVAEIVNH